MEYLRLIAHADLKQAAQARTVFEKRDEQRSDTIALLQHRLQVYKRRLLELDLHHLNKHMNNLHMERGYKLDDIQESHHQANLQDKSFNVDPNQESLQENTFGELSTDSTSDKDVKLPKMEHQFNESTKDIWEGMESFKCRIPKHEMKCNTQVDVEETPDELQSYERCNTQVDVEETPDELQSYERCNTQVDVDMEETPDELQSYERCNTQVDVDMEETPNELQSYERCNTQVDVEETPDELQSYERCNTQVDVEETPDELQSYERCNTQVDVDMEESPDELQSYERFMRIYLVILAIALVFIYPVCLCALPLIEICMRTIGTTPLVVGLMFILENWDTILTEFGNG